MKRYDGHMVIITGAAGAIGKQLAIQFQRRGAKLGLIDNNASALEDMKKELTLHLPVASAVADITDRTAITAAIHALEQQLGPVDIMIANAGVAWNNPIAGFDAKIFAQQVEINLIGMAYSLEAVLPGMIARRRGHIVALSSLASYRGLPHMSGYCASKAGVSAFMDSLRIELKPFSICCTTICPSYIRSGMNATLGVPTPGILSAEVAVNRMMRAIEKQQTYLAFPWVNHSLLVLGQLLPTWLGDWLTLQKSGVVLSK